MFREMRRIRQQLPQEKNIEILTRGTSGVLSVLGDEGYPYGVPMSYVYQDGTIYFHCGMSGHKLDAIAKNEKVCFCVIDQDQVVETEYTSYFRSVIVFGKARVIHDITEKRQTLELLAKRYAPNHPEGRNAEIERQFERVCMISLSIDHMTGKEAIELVQKSRELT